MISELLPVSHLLGGCYTLTTPPLYRLSANREHPPGSRVLSQHGSLTITISACQSALEPLNTLEPIAAWETTGKCLHAMAGRGAAERSSRCAVL